MDVQIDRELKGQCHEIFCFRFFFYESPSLKPLKITLGSFRIFSKISGDIRRSRCTTGVNDTGGHRWQIMGTISGCRHLKVNLKAKFYIYVNSTTQRCQNKIIKIFLLEGFFHLPRVSLTPVVHLAPRIFPRIFEKIWNGRNGILSRVQRIWLFFRKWRIQTLWWAQNWNLRHIYKIRFLIFWAVFCAFGFKVCKKC